MDYDKALAVFDSRTDLRLGETATWATEAANTTMTVLRAELDSREALMLDSTEVSVEQVVQAAKAAGAGVFYVHTRRFDGRALLNLADRNGHPTSRTLPEVFRPYQDQTTTLDLGFSDHGMLVRWSVRTTWFEAAETFRETFERPPV